MIKIANCKKNANLKEFNFSWKGQDFRKILYEWMKFPPIAGFSTITFYAYNHEIRVHGFLQREVGEMKRGEGKNKQSFFQYN